MSISIHGWTTFDITATGVRNSRSGRSLPFVDDSGNLVRNETDWIKARNQQRNWDTLNQIFSLRILPVEISLPQKQIRDGIALWTFDFRVDSIAGLGNEEDPLCILMKDAQDVPMITHLDETAGQIDRIIPGSNLALHIDHNK